MNNPQTARVQIEDKNRDLFTFRLSQRERLMADQLNVHFTQPHPTVKTGTRRCPENDQKHRLTMSLIQRPYCP